MSRLSFRGNHGFTLIEVLVAMAIIGLLFPLMMGIFTDSRATVKDGEHYLIAVRLAEDIIEQARVYAEQGVPPGEMQFDDLDPEDYPAYERTVAIDDDDDHDHGFIIRVKITWDTLKRPQSLTLSSRVYQP